MLLINCCMRTEKISSPCFFQDLPFSNNLIFSWFIGDYCWKFDSTEKLYFRVGVVRSVEEKEKDWWPNPPWRFDVNINNKKIKLQRCVYPIDNEILDPALVCFWYHIFQPNYFTPRENYLLKFEFWVKTPYQGDSLNYWRIFEDYRGIYGGNIWSFEYNLNIF